MIIAGRQMEGLTNQEVLDSRALHGSNDMELEERRMGWLLIREVVMQPMFVLLLAAAIIYFLVGRFTDGIIMGVSIFIVSGISIFQEFRSQNAVAALRKLSAPKARVLREGILREIPTPQVVVGDILFLEEGDVIAADGQILDGHDFSVNESLITGEAFAVYKGNANHDEVYKGTLATSGKGVALVIAVGAGTMFNKIGLSLSEIKVGKTPLQTQINIFVRNMVWIGAAAFLTVIGFNFYHTGNLMLSFLQGLTLAMSILPEEIPVAFSTFQALGGYRLLKRNVIVKQPHFVETLGSTTVICTDKTGTLTQNRMHLAYLFDAASRKSLEIKDQKKELPDTLIEYAMWASETDPFDPMEKEIHSLYGQIAPRDKRSEYIQIHEYPVGGKPPMMTHIFENEAGDQVIAAKGAPEAILGLSGLTKEQFDFFEAQALLYAKRGLRVLGVGRGSWKEKKWPVSQQEFSFQFLGLLAFDDPAKEGIALTIQTFREAGIKVKIITGDYAETALAIAEVVGIKDSGQVLTGEEILHLPEESLRDRVTDTHIFARMFPEAKLKIVNALKSNGEVVAMTGDGVNDAPALKAAHIGIAMGARGSEVAKSAASIILSDDDLSHMTEAIAIGRKIYDNLQKAIRYIVSIHIPIILVVTLPLLLSWKFTDIFSPVHVIFLELIMGPTCSIIYENEPMEPGTMHRPPRMMGNTFLSVRQLFLSILQGLVITAGCLGLGYYYMQNHDEAAVRTVIFITLLFSNIFLTLVNRSFTYSILTTFHYKNPLVAWILGFTLVMMMAVLWIPGVQQLFRLEPVDWTMIFGSLAVALVSTTWLEIFKWFKKKSSRLPEVSKLV